MANSGGNISSNDIYTVILSPTKIISGGIDKSDTNITDEDWHYMWIIIDHGSEGIEEQSLNVKTYDIGYFIKMND